MAKLGVRHTVAACYCGYITQAIVNNFVPLLFLTFQREYAVSLTLLGTLITVNFGIQLLVDCFASRFVDRIGYRPCLVAAHLLAGAGLVLLAFLPDLLPQPAAGLFVASAVYAMGGGLIEVLISPSVEACPTKNKRAAMCMLHSFYCWGQMLVVALSALFFALAGTGQWQVLACIWAVLPLLNAVAFVFVPLFPLVQEGSAIRMTKLLQTPAFWLCAALILCAGGAELSVSQWASAFAESGVGVSKTVGDLLGPCLFAFCMGVSRVLFSVFGGKVRTETALAASSLGCVGGYVLCAFAPDGAPWLALVGCAMVGLFVGILWPGVFSYASARIPGSGTALFALLALAGDAGCALGPTAVGAISDRFGGDLAVGIAFGMVFPAFLMFASFAASLTARRGRTMLTPKK